MMAWEFALERLKRKDLNNWRQIVTTSESGSLSDVHTPAHAEPGLWMRIWFAQNPVYLEVSNTYWEERVLFYRMVYMVLPFMLIWVGFGFWGGVIQPYSILSTGAWQRAFTLMGFTAAMVVPVLAVFGYLFIHHFCEGEPVRNFVFEA